MDAKAKKRKAAGQDILLFSAGEPDAMPPEHILTAVHEAINQPLNAYYSPASGLLELKRAIAEKCERENNIFAKDSEIIVTNGAKEALFLFFAAVINPGDEVIIPVPAWVSFEEQIRFFGGIPVYVPTDNAFHFTAEDVERSVTPRTKVLMLNSPVNPTGAIVPQETIEKIANLAQKNHFFVCSDEVYEHFIYDNRAIKSIASLPNMRENVITINSGSKTYAMTGWRVGYGVGPEEIIEGMTRLKSHLSSNTSNIIQAGLIAALEGDQLFVRILKQKFQTRRDMLYDGINALSDCTLAKPEGAFYAFINFDGIMQKKNIPNSFVLCDRLLDEARVALTPGEAFGKTYRTFARFSFAASDEDIIKGIKRINTFVEM